jgi:nucleotide-binding universal stress UspA family protein
MSTTERTKSAKHTQGDASVDSAAIGDIRRVLVAIAEPGESAEATIDTAVAIATAHAAQLEAVSVVNPSLSGVLFPAMENPIEQAPALRAEQHRRQTALRKHLAEHTGYAGGWSIDVPLGTPGESIVDRARQIGADLIIMGLGRHGAIERFVHDDTTLRVVRRVSVPVLAVSDTLHGMPRTVIVATDFSRASSDAARAACALFRGCARFILAYVESEFDAAIAEHDETTRVIRREGVAGAFQHLCETLAVPPGASVETVTLRGVVSAELIAFAQRSGAAALAIARQQHSMADRVMIGSVTTALLRRAPCSVFVRPIGSAETRAERR